jgi:hypothetical protein
MEGRVMKRKNRNLLGASLLGGLVLLPMSVHAGEFALYGSQTSGDVSTWGLVRFDTAPITGATTRVGSGGLMFDMDFAPDGVLYSAWGNNLETVDTTTGAKTFIGNLGISPKIMTGIAFGPNGTLYGHDNEGILSALYTIDLFTGAATPVGMIGDYAFGMDFGPNGTLYASTAGKLYTINPFTGAKDITLGDPGYLFNGLDYGVDGILRGVTGSLENNELFQIDHLSAMSLLIGPTNETAMQGLASVPEPTGLSLLTLAGIMMMRRRRR